MAFQRPPGKGRIVRAAALALTWALSAGFLGAVVGLGCYFAHPARYRSVGRTMVDGYDAPRNFEVASMLATDARAKASMTEAVLVAGLVGPTHEAERLAAEVERVTRATSVRAAPAGRAAVVVVSMIDRDPHRVQRAVEAILRHIEGDASRAAGFPRMRPGAFRVGDGAGPAERVSGFEPGTCLLVGFILGLLLDSMLVQLRDARRKLDADGFDASSTLKLHYRWTTD